VEVEVEAEAEEGEQEGEAPTANAEKGSSGHHWREVAISSPAPMRSSCAAASAPSISA
jgi:hypothetical protein